MQSVWFLLWWCPLSSVDCFHKLCLPGTPSENSQAGWDLRNRIARGYRFDVKWFSPMRSYAWSIQVFCSRWWFEIGWCLISWTEHLNTLGITSHRTDSFHVKPLAILFPRSQPAWLFSQGSTWKKEFVKTIHGQERTSSEKKSDGLHNKCSIELWTILLFQVLLLQQRTAWNKHSINYWKSIVKHYWF